MEIKDLMMFVANNFMFSFVIILVSFILGWLLYNHVIMGKLCLKEALFEKDNLAAWIEFIGAFIFPTLYLAAKAIEESSSSNIFIDLLICTAYVVGYIAVFTVLRLLSGQVVKFLDVSDREGRINLNNEIFKQHNTAAALFSTGLSVMFVNLVRFMDVQPQYIMESVLVVLNVLVFSLAGFVGYLLAVRRKTTLIKEIFQDNNIAAGVAFLGFVFALEMILGNIVILQTEFHFIEQAVVSLICLVLFAVLSFLFKLIFTAIIKVDIWNEVYEQNSIGAAIGQAALYIGVAGVIIHFIK